MAHADAVAYNVATFIATLFVLELGADKFIDHTVIIAGRTRIPETIIGLLTAGGEWEELAVVIASLVGDRASLAIGNVVGSVISNILGAFSLGLLFHRKDTPLQFDRSARVYSLTLLILTTFVTPVIYFRGEHIWRIAGVILMILFGIYLIAVGRAIGKGDLTAPEHCDSSDSDGCSDGSSDYGDGARDSVDEYGCYISPAVDSEESRRPLLHEVNQLEHPDGSLPTVRSSRSPRSRHRSLRYHVFHFFIGFCLISLAGYILSHAAATIVDEIGVPDVFFGVVLLAIATTIPEKFIAIVSGQRGHAGVLVANTVGSNIFLHTLCLGIVMFTTSGDSAHGDISLPELGAMWGSTLAFTLTIWFGTRIYRWIGAAMLTCYLAFIVLEFAVVGGVL